MDHLDPSDLAQHGLALERNLDDITTYSVGQVRRDDLTGTYCGTQRATPDNAGATVYGGSDLLVVRGDYGVLLGLGFFSAPSQAVGENLSAVKAMVVVNMPSLVQFHRRRLVWRSMNLSV